MIRRNLRPAIRALAAAAVLATGALLGACAQPCDNDHRCAVNSEGAVCNGNHYSVCDDSNRAERFVCVGGQRAAVCTASGWTFENQTK